MKSQLDDLIRKFVYIKYGTEHDEGGATLKENGTDIVLEKTRDSVLIGNSCAVEDEDAQGVVCAYFGTADGHWHFDHYLTEREIKKLKL